MVHRLGEIGENGWLQSDHIACALKAHHIPVLDVRPLFEQDAFRVGHQSGIEEAEPELASERAKDRDVSTGVHIAGLSPLHGLLEARLRTDRPQRPDAVIPDPNRAAAGGKPITSATRAASIRVLTRDQAETDRLWEALTAHGGEESMCGWLTDRWGVSWQIVPEQLVAMQTAQDQVAAKRARQAMYQMKKIDIAALERAFKGD